MYKKCSGIGDQSNYDEDEERFVCTNKIDNYHSFIKESLGRILKQVTFFDIENQKFIEKLGDLLPYHDPELQTNDGTEVDIFWDKKLYVNLISEGVSVSDFTSGETNHCLFERKNMMSQDVFDFIVNACKRIKAPQEDPELCKDCSKWVPKTKVYITGCRGEKCRNEFSPRTRGIWCEDCHGEYYRDSMRLWFKTHEEFLTWDAKLSSLDD